MTRRSILRYGFLYVKYVDKSRVWWRRNKRSREPGNCVGRWMWCFDSLNVAAS